MKIISLSGTICSGKTMTRVPFTYSDKIVAFDVQDFYKEHDCIDDNGNMSWAKFREEANKLIPSLREFLSKSAEEGKEIAIIESTGINVRVNEVLADHKFIDIPLKTPSREVLLERSKKRGISFTKVQEVTDARNRRLPWIGQEFSEQVAEIVIYSHLWPDELVILRHYIPLWQSYPLPRILPLMPDSGTADEYKSALWKLVHSDQAHLLASCYKQALWGVFCLPREHPEFSDAIEDCLEWMHREKENVLWQF